MKEAYFLNKRPIIDYDLCRLLRGLNDKGFEIIPVEKLSHCPPPKNTICFCGDINQTKSYFDIYGVVWDPIPSYPKNCERFLKRSIEKVTFEEALQKKGEYFIKPIKKTRFTPNVYDFPLNSSDMLALLHVSENCPVYMSDAVRFEQEYRCFYINNEVQDVRHYLNGGVFEFSVPINSQFIADIAYECLPFNRAYVFDVGVLSNGEWALVEFNDGISVGSYGLDPEFYADMFLARWFEIIESVS